MAEKPGTGRRPKPWDSIDRSILAGIAAEISEISETRLRAVVRENLEPTWDPDGNRLIPGITELKKIDLLGVPGAAVLATLDIRLLQADGYAELGNARIAEADGTRIPLIITNGVMDESLLLHEKIHLCQYLNPDRWPAADDMAAIAGADSQIAAGGGPLLEEAAKICRSLWTELEAYRFSAEQADEAAACDEILLGSGASASPFLRAEEFGMQCGIDSQFEAQEILERMIGKFCGHVAATVPWAGELVRNSSYSSWEEALRKQAEEALESMFDDCMSDDEMLEDG